MTRSIQALLTISALLLGSTGCTLIVSNKLDEKPEDTTDSGTGTTDGGPDVDGFVPPTDGGPTASPCDGAADGTECTVEGVSGMFVCIGGDCTVSSCGDGVVDERLEEQCDDGNDIFDDGCEPLTCTFSCTSADECDDTLVCNGAETCSEETHACEPGEPAAAGTSCVRDDGTDGVCRTGSCVNPGCGDGVLDSGEECDDENTVDGDGCDSDCTFSCTVDEDCIDADVCDGAETCDADAHVCVEGTPLECDDSDSCTADSCDPAAGCVFDSSPFDADGDGHFSAELCGGDDCDDTDATIYQGAEELCDMQDNDCDGSIDETAPTWYVDCDHDGYAAGILGSMQSCDRPTTSPRACAMGSWTTTRPASGAIDCDDTDSRYRPGQTMYYPEAFGENFDYNCNENEDRQYGYNDGTRRICGESRGVCVGLPYYDMSSEPRCGSSVRVRRCRRSDVLRLCTYITDALATPVACR